MRATLLTIVATALRWLLGGLFLWAGAVKLVAPKQFARSIDAFGLVPEPLLAPLAIFLPVVEIAIALAVLRRWRGGLPAMAGLLLAFMAVLGYGVAQNLSVDCGCFSVAEQAAHTSLRTALGRDLLMLTGVIMLGMLTRSGRKRGFSSTAGAVPHIKRRRRTADELPEIRGADHGGSNPAAGDGQSGAGGQLGIAGTGNGKGRSEADP